jgi:hypothetical protein
MTLEVRPEHGADGQPDFAAATFFIRCLAAQLVEYEG